MWFLMLGVLGVGLWYFEVGPFATLDWWYLLIPFGLALAWWAWADGTGYTKRKAMDRENRRRDARIDASREALGMLPKKKR